MSPPYKGDGESGELNPCSQTFAWAETIWRGGKGTCTVPRKRHLCKDLPLVCKIFDIFNVNAFGRRGKVDFSAVVHITNELRVSLAVKM